jgi:Fanconi anemia group M protein
MEIEHFSPSVIKMAIEKLTKDGFIKTVGFDKYTTTAALKSYGKNNFEILIEKIRPGMAIVKVNDKWRARLTTEDYNGPSALIKKNSKFLATGDLYRMDENLFIRIKEVIQKLE